MLSVFKVGGGRLGDYLCVVALVYFVLYPFFLFLLIYTWL